MEKSKMNRKLKIWLIVLILFAGVAVTTVVLWNILGNYSVDDTGAMPLVPAGFDENAVKEETASFNDPLPNNKPSETDNGEESENGEVNEEDDSTGSTWRAEPGFRVEDDEIIWSNNSEINIFSVSYENGEQVITVNSDDGDKLIAPGTETSYTFKLTNTGNVAMDYEVVVEAYFEPLDVSVPVLARISRYDGKWIAGDKETYTDVETLNGTQDSATLGAGRFTYYTLDWVWPYESGDDAFDTMLGDRAVGEDLTFTIVINTYAEYSEDTNSGDGIVPTGDTSSLGIMIAIAVGSLAMIIILLVLKIKDSKGNKKEREQE